MGVVRLRIRVFLPDQRPHQSVCFSLSDAHERATPPVQPEEADLSWIASQREQKRRSIIQIGDIKETPFTNSSSWSKSFMSRSQPRLVTLESGTRPRESGASFNWSQAAMSCTPRLMQLLVHLRRFSQSSGDVPNASTKAMAVSAVTSFLPFKISETAPTGRRLSRRTQYLSNLAPQVRRAGSPGGNTPAAVVVLVISYPPWCI